MLKIYNTLSHKKEIFKPINKDKINMYVCGVTVYDFCHIGHGRTFVVFDVISRYLRYIGYRLNYVRNITDIDDKIINRANKKNESIKNLTNIMIKNMQNDFASINILPPDSEPRATCHILEIINIIKKLINNGYAYIANNGDVMFDVQQYHDYGKLSGQKLKELWIGKQNKTLEIKRNFMDFVLWKISKQNEPYWNSPWGHGRPGWHIECSAMQNKEIGLNLDIHGGGSDLIFPHHENEFAQSVCAYKDTIIKYWIHCGMVMVNNKKMSKSLGNFLTLREALFDSDSETLRYFLMSSHYRNQLNYSVNNLSQSNMSLRSLYTALRGTNIINNSDILKGNEINKKFENRFLNAMNDDFNIPEVYSIMFDMAHEINRLKNKNMKLANRISLQLRNLASILGILQQDPDLFLQKKNTTNTDISDEINRLIKIRNIARNLKNWKEADIARSKLDKLGVIVEDNLYESTWRYK
ncbi:cysteine--tRNA ligase [Candidatus Pantoea edessiphila]|uniref:Cysteine--tRNA ligase n=1 Tax=Candidatus Pantoea edessiphila TaxID=2044610 RepID=A0A2P5SVK4_9GAMM|nr:cysteine--tRNA ligase [Candidatus Pantoea edessiphila]PPI86353.1 cysteine--tRNA ligase [Candidatus Pantoea edessiphila]